MHQLGYITDKQFEEAKADPLKVKTDSSEFGVHAEYVAEMARQLVYEQFKEDTYTRGLNVFTTITKADQDAAYLALRRGVMDYERRHAYRGPEAYIEIPKNQGRGRRRHRGRAGRPSGQRRHRRRHGAAASPQLITAVLASGEEIKMTGPAWKFGRSWLSPKAARTRASAAAR
jgi:penicillin-binding protein 1A